MVASGLTTGTAGGQTTSAVPDYGNFTALDGLFRVGIQVTDPVTGVSQSARFQQKRIDDIDDYFDPSELQAALPGFYTNASAVSGVIDIRGVPGLLSYAQNSRTLNVRIAAPDGTTIVNNGQACSFTFAGATRQDSFDTFDEAVSDRSTDTAKAIFGCLGRGFRRYSPVDPIAGNPFSLQSAMTRGALDLTGGDSLIESGGEDGANTSGDPWIIGGSYSWGRAGRFDIQRADGHINRSFRIGEGSRALLKFDLPFSYTNVKGAKSYTAQIGMGLEVPVIARHWSLEPRAAYGVAGSPDQGSLGQLAEFSLTSRAVFDGVGRGRIILGDMVGYSTSLGELAKNLDVTPGLKNWVLRNGLAYELPVLFRTGGRMSSVRVSYDFTTYQGTKLYDNNFHEVTASFGVRGREGSPRARYDLIRFNVSTIQASHFHAYQAGVGFRF